MDFESGGTGLDVACADTLSCLLELRNLFKKIQWHYVVKFGTPRNYLSPRVLSSFFILAYSAALRGDPFFENNPLSTPGTRMPRKSWVVPTPDGNWLDSIIPDPNASNSQDVTLASIFTSLSYPVDTMNPLHESSEYNEITKILQEVRDPDWGTSFSRWLGGLNKVGFWPKAVVGLGILGLSGLNPVDMSAYLPAEYVNLNQMNLLAGGTIGLAANSIWNNYLPDVETWRRWGYKTNLGRHGRPGK